MNSVKFLLKVEEVETYLTANSNIEELPVQVYKDKKGDTYFDSYELQEFVEVRTVKQMQCFIITTILEVSELQTVN